MNKKVIIVHGRFSHTLDLQERLGKGRMGEVYRVTDELGKNRALRFTKCNTSNIYSQLNEQLGTLSNIKHENIVRLLAFDYNTEWRCVVSLMQYCSGGTLNKRLNSKVAPKLKFKWMSGLTQALQHLHQNHIVHRDLKPSNVLIDGQDNVLLADFGVARDFLCLREGNLNYVQTADDYLSEYLELEMNEIAGSPYWLAPEVFGLRYREHADIFSLGCLFCAIVYQIRVPHRTWSHFGVFADEKKATIGLGLDMFERKCQLYPPYLRKTAIDEQAIKKMLAYKPCDRITLNEVLKILSNIRADFIGVDYNCNAYHGAGRVHLARVDNAHNADNAYKADNAHKDDNVHNAHIADNAHNVDDAHKAADNADNVDHVRKADKPPQVNILADGGDQNIGDVGDKARMVKNRRRCIM